MPGRLRNRSKSEDLPNRFDVGLARGMAVRFRKRFNKKRVSEKEGYGPFRRCRARRGHAMHSPQRKRTPHRLHRTGRGPAAWRRLAVDDGRTPPDGHPRTTADTAGPHAGPQEAAPARRRPSPPAQASAASRRQLRLAAPRDLNPLPQIIRTPHPTAAASDPFLSILKRRGTQGLVVCHNNKSSKKYSIRG